MKALRTIVAVVVVVAAGLAVGVVVGGKKETRTVTVTKAAATVTVRVPADGANVIDPGVETTPGETTSTGTPPPAPGAAFERVALSARPRHDRRYDAQLGCGQRRHDQRGRVPPVGATAAGRQRGRPDDVSLRHRLLRGLNYAADYYQLEITIPEGASRFVSEMGFLKGAATGNTVNVSFYKDEYVEGAAIRQRGLDSANEVAPVGIPVSGTSKLIVRFRCANPGRRWRIPSGNTPRFGFLDAHFE